MDFTGIFWTRLRFLEQLVLFVGMTLVCGKICHSSDTLARKEAFGIVFLLDRRQLRILVAEEGFLLVCLGCISFVLVAILDPKSSQRRDSIVNGRASTAQRKRHARVRAGLVHRLGRRCGYVFQD